VRRRLKSIELSPEESGLCGCWRLAAVERVTIDLTKPPKEQTEQTEIAYYAASLTKEQASDGALLEIIVGHWDAIENGAHRVRDVTFGEDASRIAKPKAARNMVTLRNLAIGLYNLLKHRGQTAAVSLPSWQRSMRGADALKHVTR
jgi:predicted transposase YbfD/YdcC